MLNDAHKCGAAIVGSMNGSTLSAAVIVPGYREADRIGETLTSVQGQGATIVVVAGDADTAAAAAAHPATDTVVEDDADGVGAARNQGVAAVDADVVLFLDADTVAPDDWVETHLAHYADPEVVGAGGPIRPEPGARLKHRVMFRLLYDYLGRVLWTVLPTQISTWNCSYRRSAFMAEGGFDEEIEFMEDSELAIRMNDRGTVVFDPGCVTYTAVRRMEQQGYLRLAWQYGKAFTKRYLLGRDTVGDTYFPSSQGISREDVYAE